MACFKFKIVIVGIGPEPQLFNLDGMLLLLGLFFFLFLLVHKLAEVDHFTYRWTRIGRHLDKVQIIRPGDLKRTIDIDNLMIFIGMDYAYFLGPNFFICIWSVRIFSRTSSSTSSDNYLCVFLVRI